VEVEPRRWHHIAIVHQKHLIVVRTEIHTHSRARSRSHPPCSKAAPRCSGTGCRSRSRVCRSCRRVPLRWPAILVLAPLRRV
jgi:hypothetical protein